MLSSVAVIGISIGVVDPVGVTDILTASVSANGNGSTVSSKVTVKVVSRSTSSLVGGVKAVACGGVRSTITLTGPLNLVTPARVARPRRP